MVRLTEAQVAGNVLAQAGIPFTVQRGKKHNKVRWEIGGKAYSYSCALTPSDWRASKNCQCAVRRVLRAAGFNPDAHQVIEDGSSREA